MAQYSINKMYLNEILDLKRNDTFNIQHIQVLAQRFYSFSRPHTCVFRIPTDDEQEINFLIGLTS